jgi:uncharacterized membrane protein
MTEDHRRNLTRRGKQALERTSRQDHERGLEDVSWGPILGGSVLAIYGLTRKGLGRLFLTGVGIGIAYRGLSSENLLEANWKRLILHTGATEPVEVKSAITVDLPVKEVYRFWRRLENLPLFLEHIESVREGAKGRSHWEAMLPTGTTIEWEAEIVEERENERLVWKSVEGSDVYNEGFVTFHPAFEDEHGTEVHVHILYRPPAGSVGAKVAGFFRGLSAQILREELRGFKRLLEAGEMPTITGQPSAREEVGPSPTDLLH